MQSPVSVQCPLLMASENVHELEALWSLLALSPYCSSHYSKGPLACRCVYVKPRASCQPKGTLSRESWFLSHILCFAPMMKPPLLVCTGATSRLLDQVPSASWEVIFCSMTLPHGGDCAGALTFSNFNAGDW